MGFRKINTIEVSETVFNLACRELDFSAEDGVKIYGYLECFNNCREQGYVLRVDSNDFADPDHARESLYVWAFEARTSDEIVVSWQTEYPSNGMFSDETYRDRRKYFHYNQFREAADFVVELVKEHFKKEFTKRG